MPYTQTGRPLAVKTPLAEDDLLLTGFSGHEAVSHLFSFQLDLVAENETDIPFDKLLGQPITVRLTVGDGQTQRYFNGVCNRLSQGGRDTTFTSYRMEIVPQFWLLTKRAQSRIYQRMSVPEILKKVLQGLDVAYEIQGDFQPRDYCVQYRETDFNFASRLMEEEGIYYFFKHDDGKHTMVLSNSSQSHPDVSYQATIFFEEVEGEKWNEDRIHEWEKLQELRSGKYTLWDHCFELPHKHLEAEKTIQESVPVGKVTHKLKVGGNDKLEIYDFPGEYAQRFDGIDRGGSEQPAELQKIFQDNQRTVGIRIQEEGLPGLVIQGTSACRQFTSGHTFTLQRHFNADGKYVLTSVNHSAKVNNFSTGGEEFSYHNHFTCIPIELPFRPARTTPKPFVQGTQTAAVVGPPGEEIFTDKYGRVKVQFHWDRQGKYNADSSCWIRVSTIWAGKGWGITNVPRIGHEVIVDFLEGDPDQPIVIGSVHNADHMPPDELPKTKMVSGLKSNSTPAGGGYNGLIFNDTKKKEMITLHGQKDMSTTIEHDDTQHIKNDRTINVDGKHTETIKKDTTIVISEGNLSHDVAKGTAFYHVKGAVQEDFDDSQETIVKNAIFIESETADLWVETATEITLHVGESTLSMDNGGQIKLTGKNIIIDGAESVTIKGGNVTSTATATHEIHGNDVKSDAKGNNVVKGAMVMLNPGG